MDSVFSEKPKKKNILDEAREKFLTIFKPRRRRRKNVIIDGEIVPRLKGGSGLFDVVLSVCAVVLIVCTGLFYILALQPLILEKYSTKSTDQAINLLNDFNKQANNQLQQAHLVISTAGKFNPDSGNCGEIQTTSDASIDTLKTNANFDRLTKTANIKSADLENQYAKLYKKYTESVDAYNAVSMSFGELKTFQKYQKSWAEVCLQIDKSSGDIKQLKTICQNLSLEQKNWEKLSKLATWSSLNDQAKAGMAWCNKVISYTIQQDFIPLASINVKKGNQVVSEPITPSISSADDKSISPQTLPQFSGWLLDFLPSYQSVMRFVPDYTLQYNSLKRIASDIDSETQKFITYNDNYLREKSSLEKRWYLLDL